MKNVKKFNELNENSEYARYDANVSVEFNVPVNIVTLILEKLETSDDVIKEKGIKGIITEVMEYYIKDYALDLHTHEPFEGFLNWFEENYEDFI